MGVSTSRDPVRVMRARMAAMMVARLRKVSRTPGLAKRST
ncbi:MAG: hypothetical protein BWY88_00427 [Synergistetes bacterium ADurb.Bin520]|nr:MAG: hypothetical protein BWY88_00427 [Synergistetes bacterium ADurb.Bin520]